MLCFAISLEKDIYAAYTAWKTPLSYFLNLVNLVSFGNYTYW